MPSPVVALGLGVVFVSFVISVLVFDDSATDVSTAVGSITGVIGTIVGAYFGVQVGSAGKEDAEVLRTEAERQAKALAAVAPPPVALAILGYDPDLGQL